MKSTRLHNTKQTLTGMSIVSDGSDKHTRFVPKVSLRQQLMSIKELNGPCY